jgi:hypothetical protein
VCDVRIEQRLVYSLGMRDEELSPELPAPFPRRVGHHEPADPPPDERESEHPERDRDLPRHPGRRAGQHEP